MPALDALYEHIFAIPRQPERTMRWRLRAGGKAIEREVVGEAPRGGPLDKIFRLLSERPDAFAAQPGAAELEGEPLVSIDWYVDGEQTDSLSVDGNGNVVLVERGDAQRLAPLEPERLEQLRQLVGTTDWAFVPDPVEELRG